MKISCTYGVSIFVLAIFAKRHVRLNIFLAIFVKTPLSNLVINTDLKPRWIITRPI
jgi:hypothetical protein